jgi:alcohol dehydrogenase class IV
MDKTSGAFVHGDLKKVVYGPGSISGIGAELDARGASKALIVTGKTLGTSPLLKKVEDALGDRCIGVFDGIAEHVQAPGVYALIEEIQRTGAEALVAFGGGSPIDGAKAAVASVLAGRDLLAETSANFYQDTAVAKVGRHLVNIAVPTTLSAGEYTSGTAVTGADRMKRAIIGHPCGPVVIINDPELTLETPDLLWASSGVKALDHAVEALYSAHGDTFTDALATDALRMLVTHLPASLTAQGEERLLHRGHAQTGAWLSNFAAAGTRYGLSHAVGHKLGSKFGISHGVTSTIALPPAMRFMAEAAPDRFGRIADTLGVDRTLDAAVRAAASADAVAAFIAALGVPTQVRDLDLGIKEEDLEVVVPALHEQVSLSGTIGRPVTVEEMSAVVHACW